MSSAAPCPALVVLGTDPTGDRPAPLGAEPLLAEADVVFAAPRGPESVALFYVEAWRVEQVDPRDAVARVAAWAAGAGPGATAVLLVTGDPGEGATAVALGAVLDGLARTTPALDVRVPGGVWVAPPHRSPLIG